jgi:hypothetical protein
MRLIIAMFTLCLIAAMTPSLQAEDINEPQQSTTGPVPPKIVLEQDIKEQKSYNCFALREMQGQLTTQHVISDVPEYFWRHGCGPTAVGMVVGYYDNHGYDALISDDAATQTYAVNQAIASGGDYDNPNPPGYEEHYEDYARPQDSYPNLTQDDYINKRDSHANNCIADYMNTSRSTRSNYYGWSWSNDVGPAFTGYVNQQDSGYNPHYIRYEWSDGLFTWDVLKNEINSNRPMVFLVDIDGDGNTDHLIPIIGYDDGVPHKYACYTTWDSMPGIRWYSFRGVKKTWGISQAWSFMLKPFAPTEISATYGTYYDKIQISWEIVTGATSYEIWRNTDNDPAEASMIADNSTSPYNDTSAVPGTTYWYWIKAKNVAGVSEFTGDASGYRELLPPFVFGNIPGTKNNIKLTVKDSCDTPVLFSLTGGGWGEVSGGANNQIILRDTTEKSLLTISMPKGKTTTINDITVNGSLKSIMAKTTNLDGWIEITGSLGAITLDNAQNGTISIGPSSNPKASVTMVFDEVSSMDIQSQMPIKSITAAEWAYGKIDAPSIGSITATGIYYATLTLNLPPDPAGKKLALGKLTTREYFSDSRIISSGNIGTITTGGFWYSTCFAGVAATNDTEPDGVLDLPNPADMSPMPATIKSITIKGFKGEYPPYFANSNIAAANILSASIAYPDYTNNGKPFGIAADKIKSLKIKDDTGTHSLKGPLDFPGDGDALASEYFEVQLY